MFTLYPNEDEHHAVFRKDKCDDCANVKWGTEFYAESATGWLGPVLFLCEDCDTLEERTTCVGMRRRIEEHGDRVLEDIAAMAEAARVKVLS